MKRDRCSKANNKKHLELWAPLSANDKTQDYSLGVLLSLHLAFILTYE